MFAALQVQAQFELQVFVSPTSPTRISKKFGLFVRASCEASFAVRERIEQSSNCSPPTGREEWRKHFACATSLFVCSVTCHRNNGGGAAAAAAARAGGGAGDKHMILMCNHDQKTQRLVWHAIPCSSSRRGTNISPRAASQAACKRRNQDRFQTASCARHTSHSQGLKHLGPIA